MLRPALPLVTQDLILWRKQCGLIFLLASAFLAIPFLRLLTPLRKHSLERFGAPLLCLRGGALTLYGIRSIRLHFDGHRILLLLAVQRVWHQIR